MNQAKFSVVILAAGQGTRMRSDTHKVLHPIAGKPMLLHLLSTIEAMGAERQVVVVGKGREQLEAAVKDRGISTALQAEQKGTGHAVQTAEEALEDFDGPVLILYGDTPFVTRDTLQTMLDRLSADDDPGVVVLASSPADGKTYGRVILGEGDRISKMVEYKDANEAERAVKLCNSGMMAVQSKDLFRWLAKVGNANAAKEYYLPDIVMIAKDEGRHPVAIEGEAFETAGVNSRAELAHLELDWQRRRREDRRRSDDPRLLAHRGRNHFDRLRGRAIRTAAAGCGARRGRQGRQFRRGEEGRTWQGRQGQPSFLHRRRLGRREGQHRGGHHYLQL